MANRKARERELRFPKPPRSLLGILVDPNAHHGRKHGQAGQEADEHARPGDHAELCDADVAGGDEGVEADRGGEGAQHQRAADVPGREAESACVIRAGGAGFAVAKGEVDPEIHAEPDEEHGKGHGDQVQVSDAEGREAGGAGQPHRECEQRREDQAQRAERQEEDQCDQEKGSEARHRRLPLHRVELLGLQDPITGDARADPVLLVPAELRKDLPEP